MAMVELQNISKTFGSGESEVRALSHISLSIASGESVAIMGPSGSGKSTLMNIIGLLDRPTEGEYKLNNQPVSLTMSDRDQSRLRGEFVGFVFQNFNLLPNLDVLANVILPATYIRGEFSPKTRATELLNQVGLGHRLHHRVPNLSGGERQRVAIARALMNKPKVLLADEPTGNLDTKSGDEVIRVLMELNAGGTTLLIVTHNDEIAARAHRTIRLRDGRIA